MKRRDFLKNTALATGGAALAGPSMAKEMFNMDSRNNEGKPNILVIMTDQQTAEAMSCAENSYIKTPNLDFLANNGTRFSRAYCNQPLCGPSRSCIFTGQLPHQVNVTVNLPQIEGYWKNIPMMGNMLKNAGYDTGYVGKWHMPCPVSDKAFHGFDYIVNTEQNNWVDPSIPKDCYDFIKHKRQNPFLLVASFTNPHDICEWARQYPLRQDPLTAPPAPEQCPPIPDNYKIPENEPDILRELQTYSWKAYPTTKWGENRWRQYRWAYNRLVEKVDYYIGMIIDTLRKFNQLENTLIVFTSDHGDGVGAHRWNQKQILYEEVVNIPFIISWPGKLNQKVNSTHLVANGQDIIPTILDYAEATQPKFLKGRSLKPVVENKNPKWRESVVLETEFASGKKSSGIKGRTVITNDYKYIVYNKGKVREQLFHLKSDPGEMNSLTSVKEHQKTLKSLRKELKEWIKETGDVFEMPEN